MRGGHDCRAEEKLRSFRSRLGDRGCHLLQINTLPESEAEVSYDGLFRAQRRAILRGGGAGEPSTHPPTPANVRLPCCTFC